MDTRVSALFPLLRQQRPDRRSALPLLVTMGVLAAPARVLTLWQTRTGDVQMSAGVRMSFEMRGRYQCAGRSVGRSRDSRRERRPVPDTGAVCGTSPPATAQVRGWRSSGAMTEARHKPRISVQMDKAWLLGRIRPEEPHV